MDRDHKGSYKGTEFTFLEDIPEDLLCIICQEILQSPMLTSCGHLFCYKCLKRTVDKKNCPICRRAYTRSPFKDEFHDRKIKTLIVRCVNMEKGCVWRGELGRVYDHLLNSSCGKLPIPCPNRCSEEKLMVEDIEAHLRVCPEQLVSCECASLGCLATMKRKEMGAHMEAYKESHLTTATRMATRYQHTIDQLLEHIQRLGEPIPMGLPVTRSPWLHNHSLYPALPWILKIDKLSVHRASNPESAIFSDPFHTHTGGYKLCLKVYPDGVSSGAGSHVGVYLCLMRGENDHQLPWPMEASLLVTLLNQEEDANHWNVLLWDQSSVTMEIKKRVVKGNISGYGRGNPRFISQNDLQWNPALKRHYLKDDSLYFRIERV